VTRLTLAPALVMTLALPPAKAPSGSNLTGNARKQACRRGRVSVPLWVCKEANR